MAGGGATEASEGGGLLFLNVGGVESWVYGFMGSEDRGNCGLGLRN